MVVRSLFATMPPAWPILVTMSASARLVRRAAREKASVILGEAEALLDPVPDIDGLMLACLVDALPAQAAEDHGLHHRLTACCLNDRMLS
jgi:hypothetical protein